MKFILYASICILSTLHLNAQSVKVMLVTGGHSYDTIQFFQLFDSFQNITYKHFGQPDANNAIANGAASQYDVLVFYDMWKSLSVTEKEAYLKLTREGKPFLFLHHSLVSYQNWPEFEQIIGGKYIEKSTDVAIVEQSNYKHDVWVDITVPDPHHPVTSGLENFRLFDEVYGNYRISPDVIPLLETNHPGSEPVIGWINRYNSSTIIYLQPGHDRHAFESEPYRKLIYQAINYLAEYK
jgi:hypothetical protein